MRFCSVMPRHLPGIYCQACSQPSAIPKTRRPRAAAPLSLGRRNDERWCRASTSWPRAIVNDSTQFQVVLDVVKSAFALPRPRSLRQDVNFAEMVRLGCCCMRSELKC